MASPAGASPALVESVSGIVGSEVALLVTYPIKTIYTLQALSSGSDGKAQQVASALQIIKRLGLEGLYTGIAPNIVETALSSGVYFYLYSWLRQKAVAHSQKASHSKSKSESSGSEQLQGSSSADTNGSSSSTDAPDHAFQVAKDTLVPPAAAAAHQQQQGGPPVGGSGGGSIYSAGPVDPSALSAPDETVITSAPHAAHQFSSSPSPSSSQGRGRGSGSGSMSERQDIGVLASFLVAALAGVGNQLITMPASVVATRMQSEKKRHVDALSASRRKAGVTVPPPPSVKSVIAGILAEGGAAGFWAGLLPSLVLTSNPSIQYMLYEQLTRLLKQWKATRLARIQEQQQKEQQGSSESPDSCPSPRPPSAQLAPWEIFLASALSKVGATVATYWLVVVKNRMQAASKSSAPELQYKGTLDALRRIWTEEGAGGFLKGLGAKVVQTALNAAVMMMIKEQIHSLVKSGLDSALTRAYSLRPSAAAAPPGSKQSAANGGSHLPGVNMKALLLSAAKP